MAHPHEVAVLHKDTYQSAGATEEEGEQEGQGEEAILLGSVDVETLVVRDRKNRGNGDATQYDNCYAQGVENDHLADHTVGVEEQQTEPVYLEHLQNAKESQKCVEDGARIERAPDVGV